MISKSIINIIVNIIVLWITCEVFTTAIEAGFEWMGCLFILGGALTMELGRILGEQK